MRRRNLTLASGAAVLTAASLLATACGSSSNSAAGSTSTPAAATTPGTGDVDAGVPATTAPDIETTAPATATAPTGGKAAAVAVVMGKPKEYSLIPSPVSVAAGKVTFNVVNKGSILHEFVIVPGASAAALKQPDGEATEDGSPGEVPDVKAGDSGSVTVTLPAGKYVLLCNLPGHFAGGMYATFKVT
jgi:uncharacterized cupredoxin-like copper-binding protein